MISMAIEDLGSAKFAGWFRVVVRGGSLRPLAVPCKSREHALGMAERIVLARASKARTPQEAHAYLSILSTLKQGNEHGLAA